MSMMMGCWKNGMTNDVPSYARVSWYPPRILSKMSPRCPPSTENMPGDGAAG